MCLSFSDQTSAFVGEKLTMSIICFIIAITSTQLSILKAKHLVKRVQEKCFYLANYEECNI